MPRTESTTRRRFAIGCGTLAAVLLLAVWWLPWFLEDRVAELIRSELDARLQADVDFEEIDLTLLSTFPRLTAEIIGLRIIGTGEFEGEPLVSAGSIGAGVGLLSLVRDGELVIEAVTIDSPEVNVIVRKDGSANYDIIAETPPDDEDSPLEFRVSDYQIRDGTVAYASPDINVRIASLEHRGSATLGATAQHFASETRAEGVTVTMGSTRMVRDGHVEVDLDATLDSDGSELTMDELRVALNALSVEGSGQIGWATEGIDLDIALATGSGQSVAALLSLIPISYAGDLKNVEASGRFSLAGEIKGRLGPAERDIPAFSARVNVRDGSVRYPELSLPLSGIDIDAKATHPGGDLDAVAVDVPQFAASAGSSHAEGSLRVRKPMSHPDVELTLKGRINGEDVIRAYPLDEVEELRGVVTTTLELVAKGDKLERLAGDLNAKDVVLRPSGSEPIRVDDARVVFMPNTTKIETLNAAFKGSDASLTGALSPLTWFFGDKVVGGNLRLRSEKIVIDELMSSDETSPASKGESTHFLLPDGIDAVLDIDVEQLVYDELVLTKLRGSAKLKERALALRDVSANAIGGTMKISGTIATPVGRPATFDLRYAVEDASFAEAFASLDSLRAYAPIARFIDGRFSAKIDTTGELGKDGAPNLRTIDAEGMVLTVNGEISSDFVPLAALNRAVPAIPKPLNLGRMRTQFRIEDGAIKVRPFDVRTRGMVLNVSGSHGLDQAMNYRIGTEVPISTLTGELERRVQKLGINLPSSDGVGVTARLTGSITDPKIAVDVDADALRGAVAEAFSQEAEARRQQALNLLSQQNEKMLAEARKRAEQVRSEAKKAADRVRKEGYKRADQLVNEAGSNPLAQIPAKEAAKQIRRETDKRAEQLVREADEQAEKLVDEAEKRAADLVKQAEEQSGRAADVATEAIR